MKITLSLPSALVSVVGTLFGFKCRATAVGSPEGQTDGRPGRGLYPGEGTGDRCESVFD